MHVTEAELDDYNTVTPLSETYDPNSGVNLLQVPGDPKVYSLDDNNTVRWIKNSTIFTQRGYRWDRILPVSRATLQQYSQGGPISSQYNDGTLVKIATSPDIWILSDGYRTLYDDEAAFWKSGYDFDSWNGPDWLTLSESELNQIDAAGPPFDVIRESDIVGGKPKQKGRWAWWGFPNGGEVLIPGQVINLQYNLPNGSYAQTTPRFTSNGWITSSLLGGSSSLLKSAPDKEGRGVSQTIAWTVPDISTTQAALSIEARDAYGNLVALGVTDSFFTIAGGTTCNTPSPPTLTPPSSTVGGNYTLGWSSSAGATSYELQEDDDIGFTSPVTFPLMTSLSKYVSGKAPGVYWNRVRGRNACGAGSWSNSVAVSVQGQVWPGDIINPSPTDGATNQNLSLTLSWVCDHPTGEAQTFDVIFANYFKQPNDGYFASEKVSVNQSAKSFAVSNLEYNQQYSWKIDARDATGDARTSPWFHFTTRNDTTPPTGSVVINSGAASTSSYSVALTLAATDSDSGVAGFEVSNNGTHWKRYTGMQNTVSWNLADPSFGGQYGLTSYTVRVRYFDHRNNTSAIYTDSINRSSSTPGSILLNGQVYATIQDALNAAVAGDTVFLTAGEFAFASQTQVDHYNNGSMRTCGVAVPAGVTLAGQGIGKTIVRTTASFSAVVMYSDSRLLGLTIVEADPYGASFYREAIAPLGSNILIDTCEITSTGTGIASYPNTLNLTVQRSLILNCGGYGIGSGSPGTAGDGFVLRNSTIVGSADAGVWSVALNLSITNCIISGNRYGIQQYSTRTPAVVKTDVYGNSSGNYSSMTDATGTNGNISSNPLFVGSGNYALQSGSPCRDAGTNVGLPANGTPDMGAFEFAATGTVAVVGNLAGASFTVYGPTGNFARSGASWSQSGLAAGIYMVSFVAIPGYDSPQWQVGILGHGQTLTFDGVYDVDVAGPVGRVSVHHDFFAVAFPRVDLTLEVSDPASGLGAGAQMQFSNDGATWSQVEPYSSLKRDWDVRAFGGSSTPGTKTVYARVSDANGNWTASPLTDVILFAPSRQILVVPDDYATITDALAVAQPGDMVHVEPGTYSDNSSIPPGVRLQGSGPELTQLNGNAYRNLSDGSMVDGFRIALLRSTGTEAIVSNNIIWVTVRFPLYFVFQGVVLILPVFLLLFADPVVHELGCLLGRGAQA